MLHVSSPEGQVYVKIAIVTRILVDALSAYMQKNVHHLETSSSWQILSSI